MNSNTRNKWSWIFCVLIICLFPVFVNWMMTVPCELSIGGPKVWISFWGAYVGAIGTIVMAIITFKTLRFSKQQTKPRVYPSLEIVVQKQYDPQATDESHEWFNEACYCLRITNYGIEPATGIHIRVSCSNSELFEKETIKDNISWLNSLEFALGPKDDKIGSSDKCVVFIMKR